MLELGSLIKTFILAMALMLLLQTKLGNQTAESHLNDWLRTSSVSGYLQEVAGGAVVIINQTVVTAKNFISEKIGHQENTQKAGRLNINLQRSEQYQKAHPVNDSKDQDE